MPRNMDETPTISKGLDYIKSVPGALKILEFIVLLVALSCMSGFVDTVNNSRGTWNFFLFAVVSSCIVTIATFFFFLLGFHEKFQAIDWPLLVGILYMIFTVLLLVAASILASNVQSYRESRLCQAWAASDQNIDCGNLTVAIIFAFVALSIYALDSIFHFWLSILRQDKASADETAQIDPAEPNNDQK